MPSPASANLGLLNRLRPTIVFPDNPTLNIIPSIIGKDGIRVTYTGNANTVMEAMVGTVNSPEPYILVSVAIPLVKTSPVGALYKSQIETYTLLGDCQMKTETSNISDFSFQNVSITGIGEYNSGGTEAVWLLTLTGAYVINSNLWNLI